MLGAPTGRCVNLRAGVSNLLLTLPTVVLSACPVHGQTRDAEPRTGLIGEASEPGAAAVSLSCPERSLASQQTTSRLPGASTCSGSRPAAVQGALGACFIFVSAGSPSLSRRLLVGRRVQALRVGERGASAQFCSEPPGGAHSVREAPGEAERPPRSPHSLSPEPKTPCGPGGGAGRGRRRAETSAELRVAGLAKAPLGNAAEAGAWTTWAGRPALGLAGLAGLCALPLLGVRLMPRAPARTRAAGTLGALFPEGSSAQSLLHLRH